MTHLDKHAHHRRAFLSNGACGIGSVALTWLLQQDQLLAVPKNVVIEKKIYDLMPKVPSAPPRAQAMISLFMQGGPSQVDLLDPKPELEKRDGESYDGNVVFSFFNRATKRLLRSPWKFQQYGRSGTAVSELLPHVAGIVDDICVIRSMHTDTNDHGTSIRKLDTGVSQPDVRLSERGSRTAWERRIRICRRTLP